MSEDSSRDDAGSAIIEFVFVAVIVMVPLIYLVVTVANVQRSELAVSQAAREAGRAFATADHPDEAMSRARAAVHIALHDQGLPDDVQVRYVPAGASCTGTVSAAPTLRAGAQFTVCVIRSVEIPGVPRFLSGKGVTTVGEYVVHIDDYRATS
jgi:Flp pilus assembly protein TadG